MASCIASTRLLKKLSGTSAAIAMPRPTAVAISASATPPVIAWGEFIPDCPMTPKAAIMPVTVPSSPSSGESVTIVSSTGRKRRSRAISCRADASIARVGAGFRCWIPAASTRAAGERDASPSFQASVHSPFAARVRTTSGSRLRPSRHHMRARSRMTARAMTEHAASGIMTGPPRASTAIDPSHRWTPETRADSTHALLRSVTRRRRSRPGRALARRFAGWLAEAAEASGGLAIWSESACPTS